MFCPWCLLPCWRFSFGWRKNLTQGDLDFPFWNTKKLCEWMLSENRVWGWATKKTAGFGRVRPGSHFWGQKKTIKSSKKGNKRHKNDQTIVLFQNLPELEI
jgi:hypothetical protein